MNLSNPGHLQALGGFDRDGFAIIDGFFAPSLCDRLVADLTPMLNATQHEAARPRGGLRNLLRVSPTARAVASAPELRELLHRVLGVKAFPVRCIFFDKTPDANWAVAWHQDLHIAVAQRIETPGFGPWSVKAGVVHVQPPAELLSRMVTVRLHLDDCDESNGALEVIPGSHAHGVLSEAETHVWRQRAKVACRVRRGGIVLMRPLLLHASASATKPLHRRVLHLEFAAEPLPNGLRWAEKSPGNQVVVALGSNLGDSAANILAAIERLREFAGGEFQRSSLWQTSPVECPPGSPPFINAVVAFEPRPSESPESLLAKLQSLEQEFGRMPKQVVNEARPLDLDLIAYGEEVRANPFLTLPHPRATQRRFVLQPLVEIAPDLMLPGQMNSVSELLRRLETNEQISKLPS